MTKKCTGNKKKTSKIDIFKNMNSCFTWGRRPEGSAVSVGHVSLKGEEKLLLTDSAILCSSDISIIDYLWNFIIHNNRIPGWIIIVDTNKNTSLQLCFSTFLRVFPRSNKQAYMFKL